jgi:hypothetical protein
VKLQWSGTQPPSAFCSNSSKRWRVVFAVLVVTVGAACVDGYPTQDVLTPDPIDMTQDQRLAEMNSLGVASHPERSWSYGLLSGCVLRIDFDGEAGPRPSIDIPLLGAVAKVSTDKVDDAFDVDVRATSPESVGDVTVLEAREWAHAIGMLRVLRFVQKGCAEE